MAIERAQRKLAAILSADVHGYSRLMERDEPGTVATIKEYRTLFAELVGQYRGRVVDSPGDNILAEFGSVVDAVESALRIQDELRACNAALPEERRMEFRIGINLGDVIEDGERLYGDGVNIAARIQALARPGGISLSAVAYKQVEGKLPLACDDLGHHRVKNINKLVRVYAIREAPAGTVRRVSLALRRRPRAVVASVSVLVAVVLWAGLWSQPAGPPVGSPSIAVLPFADMSPEQDQEYFADGLAEELLNTLSRVPDLRVVGRTSSFQFKEKNEDLRIIGRKLNVAHVMEGSVRLSGQRVRITAQLIDTATGLHVWSQTYDRDFGDTFAIQDDIATAVASASRVTLVGPEGLAGKAPHRNVQAYHLYLQGNYFRARGTAEDLAKSIGYYERALELDPDQPAVLVGLARGRNRQAQQGFVPADEAIRRSREEVARALELDPQMADAYEVLADIRLSWDWDWNGADAAYQEALRLAPSRAAVIGGAANLAMVLGRLGEALALNRRAVDLDPLNIVHHFNLGVRATWAGRWDEAEAALRTALELNPQQPGLHGTLGRMYVLSSRPEAALTEMQLETHPSWKRYGMALTVQALGREDQADAALRDLITQDGDQAAVQIAEVHAFRGEADEALRWLDRAYDQRDSGLVYLKGDPLFRNLEADPRFRAFLRKMRLPV